MVLGQRRRGVGGFVQLAFELVEPIAHLEHERRVDGVLTRRREVHICPRALGQPGAQLLENRNDDGPRAHRVSTDGVHVQSLDAARLLDGLRVVRRYHAHCRFGPRQRGLEAENTRRV